jgi:uncharacterized protein (TIGR02246 family)
MTLRSALALAAILSLSAALPTAISAQTPTPPSAPSGHEPDQLRTLSRQELNILKVLTRQEDAWNRGDIDAYASGFKNSPDILFVGRQVNRGFDQMLADYKHTYPNKESMGTLGYSALDPHILDDHYAFIIGHYKIERSKKGGGNAEGTFSLLLENTPDGWKIILDNNIS